MRCGSVRKKHRTFAAVRTTAVLLFMASDLPQALPPTVTPETTADSSNVIKISDLLLLRISTRAAMTAAAEPEITPQISPMTSLQNDDTFPALRIRRSASSASGTLREAIAWNGTSSAAVTATPMISNRIPVSTMQIRIKKDSASPAPSRRLDDTKLIRAEIRTVVRKISAIHLKSGLAVFPAFFFFAAAKTASTSIIM